MAMTTGRDRIRRNSAEFGGILQTRPGNTIKAAGIAFPRGGGAAKGKSRVIGASPFAGNTKEWSLRLWYMTIRAAAAAADGIP